MDTTTDTTPEEGVPHDQVLAHHGVMNAPSPPQVLPASEIQGVSLEESYQGLHHSLTSSAPPNMAVNTLPGTLEDAASYTALQDDLRDSNSYLADGE